MSAFPFENVLGKLKRYLRSGNKPLAQLCRRLHEEYSVIDQKAQVPKTLEIIKCSKTNSSHILQIRFKNFFLSTLPPNNIVLLKNQECYKIEKIVLETHAHILIEGKKWNKFKAALRHPDETNILQMWELKPNPSSKIRKFTLSHITTKMVLFHLTIGKNKKTYAIPFLH